MSRFWISLPPKNGRHPLWMAPNGKVKGGGGGVKSLICGHPFQRGVLEIQTVADMSQIWGIICRRPLWTALCVVTKYSLFPDIKNSLD